MNPCLLSRKEEVNEDNEEPRHDNICGLMFGLFRYAKLSDARCLCPVVFTGSIDSGLVDLNHGDRDVPVL